MGEASQVATVKPFVPQTRSNGGSESSAWQAPLSARAPEAAPREGAAELVRAAVEPSGTGVYVEAVREWIERITPRAPLRSAVRPRLHLIR